MKIDFKKDALYKAKVAPAIVDVPCAPFIMVDGVGDPNTSAEYQHAIELLYALSYAIKMSPKKDYVPEGYFDYVVAPLEGLWWDTDGSKSDFKWTAMIRQPEFVTYEVFEYGLSVAKAKKPDLDISLARFVEFEEGLCAQVLHVGSYDDEPATIAALDSFISEQGYALDITETRRHHEIYLSDPRKTAPEKLKTIIRHPIK
ncbi:MAG: GyrI-like domain-containing protein [Lactobacillales bacterium]|jgi:hypothetical protein|nr:GyrI-like domain-containing protein [Lactobacillales bacterium]